MVAQASIRLGQTAWYQGLAYWAEVRPEEQGRTVVMVNGEQGPAELLGAPWDARSRVHEYGGGAFCLGGGYCWFVNGQDQAIYRVALQSAEAEPLLVAQQNQWRFADLHWDAERERLLAVAEVHHAEQIENLIAAIEPADGGVQALVQGDDFYAYPRVSPDGKQLSWMSWQQPNMPWDETRLWLATLNDEGQPQQPSLIANGAAIYQPEWGADGELYWCADHDNWWNIYNQQGQQSHQAAECGAPLWNFAQAHWAQASSTTGDYLVGVFNANGASRLLKIDGPDVSEYALPFTHLEQLRVQGETALLVAGAANQPSQIIQLCLRTAQWKTLRQAAVLAVAPTALSTPRAICFDTDNGEQAHALFYPPQNPDYTDAAGRAAPLMVRCHGGPTSATTSALEMKYQFWTSRGFAVLDVNYRGSSGYGRAYRQSLYGQWGIKDVADAVNGARYLVAEGLANADQLFISGSSAGGFTVLSALTFYADFKAGASYYGIGDLRAIMDDTHKFEARYGDKLIGPYATHEQEYLKRSPLFAADKLSCPVIFFQGLEDKIVPPNQAQMMVDALTEKGIATKHFEFVGEGHGFRQQQTIITTLEQELAFYQSVLSGATADDGDC